MPAEPKKIDPDSPDQRRAAEAAADDGPDLSDPQWYFNRELSLLAFHERVMQLACDEGVPLLERLRFLCISASNLDEFFEVRVASLRQQLEAGLSGAGPDGLGAREQLARISEQAHRVIAAQYTTFNETLLPLLAEHDIHFLRRERWDEGTAEWVRDHFEREILPVLTPLGLDPAHPFPRLPNKNLNFIVNLEGSDAFGRKSGMALVRAPRSLPRVMRVPEEVCGHRHGLVFLSSMIHSQMSSLFAGMQPSGVYQFKVTRNSDLYVSEEDVADLRLALEGELLQRNYGQAVRLEVDETCPKKTVQFLLRRFGLGDEDLYRVKGPVNLSRLSAVPDLIDEPALKFAPFVPRMPLEVPAEGDMFTALRAGDWLLHHPYQSFLPVVELVRQAARDPDVLAIKQTLYRTGTESLFVKYLMEAARRGKDVTVIIELRARFDEEANIQLATQLQEAGIQVVYGVVGHKTHAKLLMVVRREKGKLMKYAQLGTGNYHTGTARAYTDCSLLTADKAVTGDVSRIFTQLTGLGRTANLRTLLQSPFTLHERIIELIGAEAEAARSGQQAHIMARMNSLMEPRIIQALYQASQAGVRIELVVRGICGLRPGVPGVSENIRVVSVLGRFLEHSRVFHFHAGGKLRTCISSADWLPRNFFSRVEAAVPLKDPALNERVVAETLRAPLADTRFAWELQADGSYRRVQPAAGESGQSSQELLLEQLASLPLG